MILGICVMTSTRTQREAMAVRFKAWNRLFTIIALILWGLILLGFILPAPAWIEMPP